MTFTSKLSRHASLCSAAPVLVAPGLYRIPLLSWLRPLSNSYDKGAIYSSGRVGTCHTVDATSTLHFAEWHPRKSQARSTPMMDVAMLAIRFTFFALSIAYVYACDLL